MLDQKYQILVDFDVENILSEYFNINRIHFQYLDLNFTKDPLIDVIKYKARDTKPIFLIIKFKTLERLLEERSPYNDFRQMVSSGQIRIAINSSSDPFFNVHRSFNLLDYGLGEDYYKDHPNLDFLKNRNAGVFDLFQPRLFPEISTMPLDIIVNGSPGNLIRAMVPRWNFVFTHHWFQKGFWSGHLYHTLGQRRPDKAFFTLIRFQNFCRAHRRSFMEAIKHEDFMRHAIVKTTQDEDATVPPIYDDTLENYPPELIGSLGNNLDPLPITEYYERSYFEVACETGGEMEGDDSFYVTEKICKPMMMKHPFVVVGTKHYLKQLRSLGFRTFEGLIDESYDELDSHEQRAIAIKDLLKTMTMDRSRSFYDDSREICEHNQKHLITMVGRYKFDLWARLKEYFNSI